VTFEPFYDSYAAAIALSGATRRTVPLRGRGFVYDPDELRAAFSERTTVVLVNTPHNPTGTVFSHLQLTEIGRLAAEFDAVVVTDEVYEHMTFDGTPHVPMATLPGMAERTLTISSAGKTFSVTGWKVGWVHGPSELVAAARAVKQFLTFHGGTPLQPAVANALASDDAFFTGISAELGRKRDLLSDGLRAAGFDVYTPRGTYFVVADASPMGVADGVDLAWKLPGRCGVAAVPVSVFCSSEQGVEATKSLVRFAFCKRDEVLSEAAERLACLPDRV
ncbi:MAG: aminotransferase class I/II-fold pyridoxal phosphate-dependent enzyme, partial [Actinomycetota bacterium]|nr:aminotransferase class I/II-fold pyridoxal phosphate-dependent enzyme [Actinomycetota bacterium]